MDGIEPVPSDPAPPLLYFGAYLTFPPFCSPEAYLKNRAKAYEPSRHGNKEQALKSAPGGYQGLPGYD